MQLISESGAIVAIASVDEGITCGMELYHIKLWPYEVAVRVLHVLDGSIWTGELVGERLSQCVGLLIRWKKSRVRTTREGRSTTSELGGGQSFSFSHVETSEFEFDESNNNRTLSENSLPTLARCSTT